MTDAEVEWADFNCRAIGRSTRELLRRTLGCIALASEPPGVAVDLGCGSGVETLELLRQGWVIHAVDSDPSGTALLHERLPKSVQTNLHTHLAQFEAFTLPSCDFVWAGYSLPFCPASHWPELWAAILAALRPGGRFAGDFFGDKHAFACEPGVVIMKEADLRGQLSGLTVEAFDIEDGVRPSGGRVTRWHAFGIAVRKPHAHADA